MKLNIGLNSAYDEIIDTYSLEDMHEIVSNGCQSGMCHEHIYYADTIKFFDNHEDEITEYFNDYYDEDFLVNMFKEAGADLTYYKNQAAWAYIEATCVDILSGVDEALLQPIS